MHSLTLSKEQMRKIRHALAAKGVYFPTSNELLDGRKKLRPVISPILNNQGVEVNYKEVVKMTVQSVVSMVSEKLQEHDSGELEFIFKDGGEVLVSKLCGTQQVC